GGARGDPARRDRRECGARHDRRRARPHRGAAGRPRRPRRARCHRHRAAARRQPAVGAAERPARSAHRGHQPPRTAPHRRALRGERPPPARGRAAAQRRQHPRVLLTASASAPRTAPTERTPTVRTVISLIVALVASLLGTVVLWYGGGHAVYEFGRFGAEGAGLYPLVAGLGCVLLAGAAVTVRWSRVGVIAAGSVHVLFSLFGILVPFQPMDGISSPATQLLGMLFDLDPALGTGGYYFVAFGGGLLIGFALLGVGVLARRGRPTVLARVLSAVAGVLALGAAGWTFATGGDFYRQTFQILNWDAVVAITLVVAALIFEIGR